MKKKIYWVSAIIIAAGLLGYLLISSFYAGRPVDFSTEVKPILNKHCISCHGGVKQNAGFSVLFREEALGKTKSGKPAIIPGHPGKSEFIRRISTRDSKERMPYKHPPLPKEDIRTLTRWVKQGAHWGTHWAYALPEQVSIPDNGTDAWPKNGIDHFILDRLKKEELSPSPEADKITLLRRVSLDLTGLPPTPAMTELFLHDNSPRAYEKVVDSLLASPHYGERWASMWLDLARYADTKGYERDPNRLIWLYRDWLIKAFNDDMPFDQFTIRQLAGDLLPQATDDDLVATAFHRNTMTNDESGTDDEEFRTIAVMDRVNTTWQVWEGTTFACVQCHSHPYDPFKHDDYYKFMAFFNNTRDEDSYGDHPHLRVYDTVGKKKMEHIFNWVKQYGTTAAAGEVGRFLKTNEPRIHVHNCDDFVNGELIDTKILGIRNNGHCRLKNVLLEGKTQLLVYLLSFFGTGRMGGQMEIHLDSLNGPLLTNYTIAPVKRHGAVSVPLKPVSGTHDLYLVFRNPALPPQESVCAIEWFAFRGDLPGKGQAGYSSVTDDMLNLLNTEAVTVPVMVESPQDMHRPTFVFERGNWLVHGKQVTPDVPRSLNAFPEKAPRNRLGMAQWLVSPNNPLTARVMVNRCWEQLFGTGIVESPEDFGSQGFTPSHPALLDWLALRFMREQKWSLKKMLKEMVMSATYRQSSRTTPALEQQDPVNLLLARGPHFRLSAEQIRDQVLAVSGLLSEKMYGPGVMPYQPPGIWQTVYSLEGWTTSPGEDRHRRAVYTFIKRTSPYPSFTTFDGSSREVCLSRRIRTNTPLQALVTLNDPVFTEAARCLADTMKAAGGKDVKACIRSGYKRAMLRDIPPDKLVILQRLYQQALQEYKTGPEAAEKFLQRKETRPAHTAALAVVAGAILNLDEFLIKS